MMAQSWKRTSHARATRFFALALAVGALMAPRSAAARDGQPCGWSRLVYPSGNALNPVELIAKDMAKRSYADDVGRYERLCVRDRGVLQCNPSAGTAYPTCTRTGANYLCQASGRCACRCAPGG